MKSALLLDSQISRMHRISHLKRYRFVMQWYFQPLFCHIFKPCRIGISPSVLFMEENTVYAIRLFPWLSCPSNFQNHFLATILTGGTIVRSLILLLSNFHINNPLVQFVHKFDQDILSFLIVFSHEIIQLLC